MTADEIRQTTWMSTEDLLREICAQIAELNEKLRDYFLSLDPDK